MDRDDQEMNRFLRRAIQLAAANKLTVTLHGCPKPVVFVLHTFLSGKTTRLGLAR